MKIAKSTYYFELNRVDAVAEKNGVLLSEIKKIFHENKGIYGVRRIYQELCRRGYVVNHKRVQRLMHVNGLFGKRPKEKYHLIKAMLGKLLIILLTEILRPIGHFKNGVQMYLNSLFLGENVSFLQF